MEGSEVGRLEQKQAAKPNGEVGNGSPNRTIKHKQANKGQDSVANEQRLYMISD